MMHRTALVFGLTVMMGWSVASAQSEVALGGELFFRLRVASGGLSEEQRAEILQERLTRIYTALFTHQVSTQQVTVRHINGEVTICVGDLLLVTVTERDARANQTTVSHLANQWLENTRQALSATCFR